MPLCLSSAKRSRVAKISVACARDVRLRRRRGSRTRSSWDTSSGLSGRGLAMIGKVLTSTTPCWLVKLTVLPSLVAARPAHLMVERVIDTGGCPCTAIAKRCCAGKIGIAHGVLRPLAAGACRALATTPLHCLPATRSTSSPRLARGSRLLDARRPAGCWCGVPGFALDCGQAPPARGEATRREASSAHRPSTLALRA